jgi:aldehyde:ferredoxin oxidoreductase
MIQAWRGQYLEIDLTTGETRIIPIPIDVLTQTIGGVGLAAQLVYDHLPANIQALDPENVLVFAAGPLGGTTFAGSGRLVIAGLSPLTGAWGESSLGGYFATHIKRCGYDALLFRGASQDPVVLVLQEDHVELIPADDLWGTDSYTTENSLISVYPGSEVITIGPAGENMVPMASLIHHKGNNIAARCGLGAVAGSKHLKAIVAKGTGEVPVAEPDTFNQLKKEAIQLFNQHDFLQVIRRGSGTAGATPIAIEMGDMPAKNWDLAAKDWADDRASNIAGPALQAQFPPKQDTCYACPVACKWTTKLKGASGEERHTSGPEYESIAGLGSQVLIDDPRSVIESNALCNQLGLDTISTGATIAWLFETHQKGLVPEDLIDKDLDLEWGDPELVLELIRRIAANQAGLGALLANGSRRAAELINAGGELAIHVKGLELPFHHPRALRGLEIAYATIPRGATHNEEGTSWDHDDTTYAVWVGESIAGMNLSAANSSMVLCQFLAGALNADFSASLLSAVSGKKFTTESLIAAGERSWYLRRAINTKLGLTLADDVLPDRIKKQIKESPASLNEFDKALTEFHKQRNLDERGVASARKLKDLQLDFLIDELNAQ